MQNPHYKTARPIHLQMPDAEVVFYPEFFSHSEADALLTRLLTDIDWKQENFRLYGKSIPMPRLTAWYGDPGKSYTYSGLTFQPEMWTETLLVIKSQVETVAATSFNSVLLNLYRGQQDSMGWHSDDEPELGLNPVIASVTFGATRSFQFKHKIQIELRKKIDLTHGSLLLMQGPTQHFWKHQVPKTTRPLGPRINLTFRIIK